MTIEAALLKGQPVLGIGLMSGTSADGIDAAAVELWRADGCVRTALRAFVTLPYPPEVRALLFQCFEDRVTVRGLCLLNARVGELFADAAEAALRAAGRPDLPAFAASHGQTVWHQPEAGLDLPRARRRARDPSDRRGGTDCRAAPDTRGE